MAVRITHTNNSQGHDGTYVYRSTSTMDPQALPAPIADEPPVALGQAFEYIDNESPADGTYYYRTQDHGGGQVSVVSGEVSITTGEDFSAAQVGDYIGGGVYAGTITYADARQYHIIFSLQSGEKFHTDGDTRWKTSLSTTAGANDVDDGEANTTAIEAAGIADHPAAQHCRGYVDPDGNADYYLPAINELVLADGLVSINHPEVAENLAEENNITWSSTEYSSAWAWKMVFIRSDESGSSKTNSFAFVRPVRRVAV